MLIVRLLGACVVAALALPANAVEFTLISPDTPDGDWSIDSTQLNMRDGPAFKVRLHRLRGGRQEGSALIEIDTGSMQLTVVPTRGMNVLRAQAGSVRLGWDSPVTEVVNPAFLNLESRSGLGWLEGFNELVARCGFEWVGHPGNDRGELLTLHGRASSLPARTVVLSIDDHSPHRITLTGTLSEAAFKKVNFRIDTALITEPGATAFTLHDRLTNQGDQPMEYQALYHSNIGTPLLEQGARVAIPVREISPFNARAQQELNDWQIFRGPTAGYGETVYNIYPLDDGKGQSLAVLHDAGARRGIELDFNITQLPVFSLWKNTDSLATGYVTGLEPGTSFSYNRSLQRGLGLVPTIEAGATRDFVLQYRLLATPEAVETALQEVRTLQARQPPKVRQTPLAHEP
nr:aldose 1-epimerase family protein [Xanthomonas dyei]